MNEEDRSPNLDWKTRLKKTLRLKNIEKIRHYFIEEIYQNELMSLEETGLCNSKFYWTFS